MLLFTGKFNATQYSESDEVCVKVQKPACPWELYICRELRERLLYLDDDVNRDIVSSRLPCALNSIFDTFSFTFLSVIPIQDSTA